MTLRVPNSKWGKARAVCEKYGEFTVSQVQQEIGELYPATLAMASFRTYLNAEIKRGRGGTKRRQPYSTEDMITIGRRRLVQTLLTKFLKEGFIRRIGKGRYVFVSSKETVSLYSKIYDAIAREGECSLDRLLELFRDEISSSRAIHKWQRNVEGRRRREGVSSQREIPLEKMAEYGKRETIRVSINTMVHRGAIRRVRTNVYAIVEKG